MHNRAMTNVGLLQNFSPQCLFISYILFANIHSVSFSYALKQMNNYVHIPWSWSMEINLPTGVNIIL